MAGAEGHPAGRALDAADDDDRDKALDVFVCLHPVDLQAQRRMRHHLAHDVQHCSHGIAIYGQLVL